MRFNHFQQKHLIVLILLCLLFFPHIVLADGVKSEKPLGQDVQSEKNAESPPFQNILPIEEDVLEKLNDEQWEWYERFNKGILFFDGWQSISQSILEHCPSEKRHEIRRFIQRLGVLIGTEWSRENNIRRIDNSMLSAWGDRMKAAIRMNEKDKIIEVLYDINREVEKVLEY